MKRFVCAFTLSLLLPMGAFELTAQTTPMRLAWDTVTEARGYVVQVRSKADASKLQEFKVTENKLETPLPAGLYDVRVAALNKFGKPAAFTEWIPVKLEVKSAAPVNLSRKEQPKPESKPEPARQEPARMETGKLPLWNAFVPGMIRIRRGNYAIGGAYIAGLAGIGYLFYTQKVAGDRIAEAPLNDPILLAPVILTTQPLSGYLLINQRDSQKAVHARHQNNQKGLAGLGMALYAFQCVDAILWADTGKSISFKPGSTGSGSSIAFSVRF
ncbi:MAG: hypothetical protein JNM27_03795 [Leptospirales bacterium]|nr:hypothetical protein [Leptospirales bacterium]